MQSLILRRAAAVLAVCAFAVTACPITSFADTAPGYRPNPKFADAEGPSLSLTRKTISMEEANEPQVITLTADTDSTVLVASMGVHIDLDPGLELLQYYDMFDSIYAGDFGGNLSGITRKLNNGLFVSTASASDTQITSDGLDLFSFKVKVKDPKPGKKYYINFIYYDGDCFKSKDQTGSDLLPSEDYMYTHVEQGYIQIEGEYDPSTDSSEYVPEPVLDRSSKAPESSETPSSAPESSRPESSKPKDKTEWQLGDVNNDKTIDIEDAVLLINNINGVKALDKNEILRGDVDQNKSIDIEDAVGIIGHVNGAKAISGKVSPDEETSSSISDSSKAENSSEAEESSKPDDSSTAEPEPLYPAPELDEGEYWVTIVNDNPLLMNSLSLKYVSVSEGAELFNNEKQPYSFPDRFETFNDKILNGCGSRVSFGVRDPSGKYQEGTKISVLSNYGNPRVDFAFDPYIEDDGSHHITIHYNSKYKYKSHLEKPILDEGKYWITIHNLSTKGKARRFRYQFNNGTSNTTYNLEINGGSESLLYNSLTNEYKPGGTISLYDEDDRDCTTPLLTFDPFDYDNDKHEIHIVYDEQAEKQFKVGDVSISEAKIPELKDGRYWITINNIAPVSTGVEDIRIDLRPGAVFYNSNGTECQFPNRTPLNSTFESGDVLSFGVSDVRDVYQEGCIMELFRVRKYVEDRKYKTEDLERILRFDVFKYADENHQIVINYDGTNWYVK